MPYIGIWQVNVAQWVALRPIFEVCTDKKGHEGEGRMRGAWWRQEAAEKQLQSTLAEACESKSRRRQGGGVRQWEQGYSRRRAVIRDSGLETSNDQVG